STADTVQTPANEGLMQAVTVEHPRSGPGSPGGGATCGIPAEGAAAPPPRVPVPTCYGCVGCGAARYGNVVGKATSFEPTQSVVTKPSVISPSSASMTSSAGLRPFRKP